ncbi:RTA1 like protein-domain-containing protein [Cyathus striatus]|nr:RTA1 like protein-domain-containing protein [Cyathus striatus]
MATSLVQCTRNLCSTQALTDNGLLISLASIFADVQQPVEESPYHYTPTQYVTLIMIALFAISTIAHTVQAVRYRLWWMFPTACLCDIAEIVGWSARLLSSIKPLLSTPFTIQITTTIIAPTPLVAANFIILGRLISQLGPQYSRLSPSDTIILCSCDILALVLQGVGGGMASAAETPDQAEKGGHVMLGGIFLQLIAIIVYAGLGTEFIIRYLKNKPLKATPYTSDQQIPARGEWTGRLRIMSFGLAFSTMALFIRAVYRTAELINGWSGRIISTEVYFNVLDGAMVILAIYTLNLTHPGFLLRPSGLDKLSNESVTASETELNIMKGRR